MREPAICTNCGKPASAHVVVPLEPPRAGGRPQHVLRICPTSVLKVEPPKEQP